MTDDLLNDMFAETGRDRKAKSGKSGKFSNPTDGLDRGAAERTTVKKSLKAGQYIRRQFTFRPEQLNRIRQLAREMRVPEADLVRWLVDRGMQAIERDGERPDTIDVSTTRLAPP